MPLNGIKSELSKWNISSYQIANNEKQLIRGTQYKQNVKWGILMKFAFEITLH